MPMVNDEPVPVMLATELTLARSGAVGTELPTKAVHRLTSLSPTENCNVSRKP